MRGAEFFKSGIRQSARATGRLIKLAVLCAAAAFSAALFTVLFSGAVVTDPLEDTKLESGDYVLAWKPAYVFSIPRDGDLVLSFSQGELSSENRMNAAVYSEETMEMASVRGKIVMRIPKKFVPGR